MALQLDSVDHSIGAYSGPTYPPRCRLGWLEASFSGLAILDWNQPIGGEGYAPKRVRGNRTGTLSFSATQIELTIGTGGRYPALTIALRE